LDIWQTPSLGDTAGEIAADVLKSDFQGALQLIQFDAGGTFDLTRRDLRPPIALKPAS